jgi:tetratricopeptide (TPR) repeat protein
VSHGLYSNGDRSQLYLNAFFRHDEAGMARELEAVKRSAEAYRMIGTEIGVASYQGKLAHAIELGDRFESEATAKTGLKGAAAGQWCNVAQTAAAMGDADAVRASVRKALALDRSGVTLLNAAFALVVLGDTAQGEALAAEVRRSPLASSEDGRTGLALIDALVKMRKHDRTALTSLPTPKDDNDTGLLFAIGVVNLAFDNNEVAAREFSTITSRPVPSLSTLSVEADLYLGRALAKMGKTDESRKAYERFLDRWKNADAGLPILAAAKREYAALGR